jgi:secreted trypsin-like serine protease
MVLVSPHGEDTCDGDSGGPVFEWDGTDWRIVAVTSRPIACARRRCGDGGVYVRVDRIERWLSGVVAGFRGLQK